MKATINDVIRAAGIIKTIKRSGWVKKARIKNAESVADHSYRMALIGLIFGTDLGLDAGKITRMCLIHDLAESQIGDLMPEEKKNQLDHRKREDSVMKNILSRLPNKSSRILNADWKELIGSKSDEAKLVWQLDKLEMGLQMKDYITSGYSSKRLKQFDPSSILTEKTRRVLERYR